jgi:hypothetical protein
MPQPGGMMVMTAPMIPPTNAPITVQATMMTALMPVFLSQRNLKGQQVRTTN